MGLSKSTVVRSGKGGKERYTTLPAAIRQPIQRHRELVRKQHMEDLQKGLGSVALPNALDRKYPNAPKEWGRQWVFPATTHYVDSETGARRRHHLHESVLQKAFREARLRAPASPSRRVATPCGIPSPRISWKTVTTSGPSRNCSGMRM
jgi:hypothetical protein